MTRDAPHILSILQCSSSKRQRHVCPRLKTQTWQGCYDSCAAGHLGEKRSETKYVLESTVSLAPLELAIYFTLHHKLFDGIRGRCDEIRGAENVGEGDKSAGAVNGASTNSVSGTGQLTGIVASVRSCSGTWCAGKYRIGDVLEAAAVARGAVCDVITSTGALWPP